MKVASSPPLAAEVAFNDSSLCNEPPQGGLPASEAAQGCAADFDPPAELKLSRIRIPRPSRLSLPEVDREFIKNCLHLEDCEPRVAAHHRSLFHSWYAGDIEQAVQNRDLVKEHIRGLEGRIRILSRQILKTDELVRQEQEAGGKVAWSTLDLVTAAGLGLFSLVLLGMGINTLATYLMDSGFILFVERPALAYLLSAVNVGLAVLLKVGSSWCRDDVTRHRYFVWLWGSGLVSGALWLVTFAVIFPNIGAQGVDEIIASLGEESALKDAVLEGIFVCSQLVSEICISAALWMHLERMTRAHAPALVVASNPEHRGYLSRLSECNESLRAAVEKRASLEGWLKELQACESVYLSKANSAAKAGLAARQAERYGLNGGNGATGLRNDVKSEDSR